ncbi:hypothetical protein D3C84_234830 [compost metagenome]
MVNDSGNNRQPGFPAREADSARPPRETAYSQPPWGSTDAPQTDLTIDNSALGGSRPTARRRRTGCSRRRRCPPGSPSARVCGARLSGLSAARHLPLCTLASSARMPGMASMNGPARAWTRSRCARSSECQAPGRTCQRVETEVHQALGHVLHADPGLRLERAQIDDALVRHPAVAHAVEQRECAASYPLLWGTPSLRQASALPRAYFQPALWRLPVTRDTLASG